MEVDWGSEGAEKAAIWAEGASLVAKAAQAVAAGESEAAEATEAAAEAAAAGVPGAGAAAGTAEWVMVARAAAAVPAWWRRSTFGPGSAALRRSPPRTARESRPCIPGRQSCSPAQDSTPY